MKQKIIDLSRELFIKEGIQKISIDIICEQLGISKKSFYVYFQSKESLIETLMRDYIEEFEEEVHEVEKNAKNEIEELIQITNVSNELQKKVSQNFIFDIKKYYPNIWMLLENFGEEKVSAVYLQNFNKGQKNGFFRNDIPSDFVAYIYNHGLFNVIDYFGKSDRFTLPELKTTYLLYHFRGICTEKGLKELNHQLSLNNI